MKILATIGIICLLLWHQNSMADNIQEPSSPHNYSMVDDGTYGYEGALSEDDIHNGIAIKPLIMMHYLGHTNGTYTILILGSDLNNQILLNRVSCKLPCTYAKSEIVSGNLVLNTQMLPVNPKSIIGAMLEDAVSGKLIKFEKKSEGNPENTLESRSIKLFQEMENGDISRAEQYSDSGDSGKIKSQMINNWSHPRTEADWMYLKKLDATASKSESNDECGADYGACKWKEPFLTAERQLYASGLTPPTGDFPYLALRKQDSTNTQAASSESHAKITSQLSTQKSYEGRGICDDMNACFIASLVAAKHEDINELRHIATLFDSLPKPDLGNKSIARELNKKALEVIKNNDYSESEILLEKAYKANPRDVEVAANYGLVMAHQQKADSALTVLKAALLLDPRRTSTWVPAAIALNASGHTQDAVEALWVAYQWSSKQDTTIEFYAQHANASTNDAMTPIYATALAWLRDNQRPQFVVTDKKTNAGKSILEGTDINNMNKTKTLGNSVTSVIPGNAGMQGNKTDQSQLRSNSIDSNYGAKVRTCVQAGVTYSPPPQSSFNPRAQFRIQLAFNGQVIKANLTQSSGIPAFDSAVQRGILACNPFPKPSLGPYPSSIDIGYDMY